jgi:hypothetical protein
VTVAGWIFLGLGWGGVVALVVFCLARVIEAPATGTRDADGDPAEPRCPLP